MARVLEMQSDRDPCEITKRVPCEKRSREGQIGTDDLVPVEEPIAVILNGAPAIDITMSPRDIGDFVVGHLICEGRIDRPAAIRRLEFGAGWVEADFGEMTGSPRIRETIFSSCFGSSKTPQKVKRLESNLHVLPREVDAAMRAILASETHGLTGGVHTAGIFVRGPMEELETVSLCEDVGRHTALDKAVGKAARAGCDLSTAFLATTGRASSEMVAKCYHAGIAVIVSRGATTDLAIQVANSAGITLIGFARAGRFNVYTNSDRIPRG